MTSSSSEKLTGNSLKIYMNFLLIIGYDVVKLVIPGMNDHQNFDRSFENC